ncbi:MAG: hypothetical protein AAGU11_16215 [Syntrophobacteraceae bacterium]
MKFRISKQIDMTRDRIVYGIEVQGRRGKWFGVCSHGRGLIFDLSYDACAFKVMLEEIAGSQKPAVGKRRKAAKLRRGICRRA